MGATCPRPPRLHTTHVESSEVLFGIPYLRGLSVCIINGVLDGSKKHTGREKRGCGLACSHSLANQLRLARMERKHLCVCMVSLVSVCMCAHPPQDRALDAEIQSYMFVMFRRLAPLARRCNLVESNVSTHTFRATYTYGSGCAGTAADRRPT